ncbi:carboxypeptidase-like regulatory domain-containing protein [Flavobacterium lacisediminis]|uniref:Carboxypeptidase-like regulatory domain-containing protein n=1 Tax=Flavobacterium lacisediminis TaxID=2989705 RepID=A0ABT3EFD2_9FLAO|nr:carboxypeptidase-like regulatory domain-containing protein [Flavobacterium lacisediminis]MCW1147257.1 carboxypeptidase-like regulatory domain-containing protein [Flavobacterium lacisediminis]
MIKLLLFFLFLFHFSGWAQSDTIIKGKIVSTSSSLEGIHILNLNKGIGIATDDRGYFSIRVTIGDTLQFSAIHLIGTKHIIKKDDFGENLLFVEMKSKLNELEEVTIVQYKNINAVSLGIIPKNQKTYTPAERKLKTASEMSIGTIISIDPLLNWISGRTRMLKKEVEIEIKEFLIDQAADYYQKEYFTDVLKIPEDYVDGFLFYIVENERFVRAMKDKNKTMATFILSELAVEYLKVTELQPSTSVKNEK